jgi:tetratricopeptide (TPR) repeat protein
VKDIAQFTLDIDVDPSYAGSEPEAVSSAHLPVDLRLDDEVRLEKIRFAEADRDQKLLRLDAAQQGVLMARFVLRRRALPVADELALEELQPHLAPMLDYPAAWSLYTAALLNRSQLESKYSRSVERARAQLETILENLSLVQPRDPKLVSLRMRHIHNSWLPPLWEVEKSLADILLSLGATKAALERYQRLQRWDEVIACFNLLQLRHRAAEVIREQMKSGETARLWCQLGDATDDLQCYHKALELSHNRNARAFKSLGLHFYFSQDYSRAVDYFQQSLNISRFQLDLWLRLGFAALELERWSEGAQAYRSYTSLESDNFEAWNNLAKCYIKLGQKERAWRVLHEAVRCDYDSWKVWDNLMVIATDLAAFEDTLRAYNRILDLKQTHLDAEVLEVLVKAVTEGIPDRTGTEPKVAFASASVHRYRYCIL